MPSLYGRLLYGRALYSAGGQLGAVTDTAVSAAVRRARLSYVAQADHAAVSDGARAARIEFFGQHATAAVSQHSATARMRFGGKLSDTIISSSSRDGVWVGIGDVNHMALSCSHIRGGVRFYGQHAAAAVSSEFIMGRLVWEAAPAPLPGDWTPVPLDTTDIWIPHPPGESPWVPEVH